MEQKFYNVGDSVEREIDGSWFVGEVRVVNAAGNEIDERSTTYTTAKSRSGRPMFLRVSLESRIKLLSWKVWSS